MNATRPLGFWLKLVDSLIDEQFAATLEEHGVTRRQWQVLNLLEQNPASEAELTTGLSPFFASPDEPQSVTEHLAELVESGWISRQGGEYLITERGHVSLVKLSELVERIRTQCGEGLTPEAYSTTVSSLEQMAKNFGWAEAETE
ncbi:MarR family winged helix-turn-helix transcriptional regulator [Glutamicibacter sp. 287]|uniref:MarR family winged helix-turn-helix transcriptional regulator n=1 Tax=unclassified Glutamicibacter TaxID=2627139 RepID=UPI000BB8AF01|nr:helix-turn-helix domain-containing protein [Glutamicibacter sp. BW80]PCC28963.1 transcriptional regulator [Glutamicibacter sp. BW80]